MAFHASLHASSKEGNPFGNRSLSILSLNSSFQFLSQMTSVTSSFKQHSISQYPWGSISEHAPFMWRESVTSRKEAPGPSLFDQHFPYLHTPTPVDVV